MSTDAVGLRGGEWCGLTNVGVRGGESSSSAPIQRRKRTRSRAICGGTKLLVSNETVVLRRWASETRC